MEWTKAVSEYHETVHHWNHEMLAPDCDDDDDDDDDNDDEPVQ